jgi:hypothetical protein
VPWYGSHSFLNKYVRENRCRKIMGIGVYTGKNAASMVKTAIKNAAAPQEVAYTMDSTSF